MNRFIWIGLSCLFIAAASPTPQPTWSVTGATVDLSTVTEEDIAKTIAHRNALHEQLIQETLPAASQDVKDAVSKAQVLQKDIDQLALQAAKVPILEADLAKAHKACWRNLFGGLAAGAILGVLGILIGPKLLELGV